MITEIFIALLGALTGGGLTGVFAWRAHQRKAEGEAIHTEAEAMKSVQDVYQQALADQQEYITQLKEARDHIVSDRNEMRKENNELRKRLNDMDSKVRQLEQNVERNNKLIAVLRPFLCGRIDCPTRTSVNLGNCTDSDSTAVVPTTSGLPRVSNK